MKMSDFRNRETAQKAPEFIRNAFNVDRKNARYVSLARCEPTRRGWSSVTITKEAGQRARSHRQRVHPPQGYSGSFRKCSGLQLDCDCSRHVFVWNWALNDAGLAVKDRTNGEPPEFTNPEHALGCCKHLVIVLRYLWTQNPVFNPPKTDSGGRAGSVSLTTLRQALRRQR